MARHGATRGFARETRDNTALSISCEAVASRRVDFVYDANETVFRWSWLDRLFRREKMTLTRTAVIPKVIAERRAFTGSIGLTGCPWHDVKAMLREVGLRPTRQRMALGWILFGKGDRHLTAEMLYEEATRAKVPVSLATIYNTLHQFTEVGLLRQVAVDGSKAYFDTNVTAHHHFFVEGEDERARYPGRRGDCRQDADPARGLRDRARGRGRPAAQKVLGLTSRVKTYRGRALFRPSASLDAR